VTAPAPDALSRRSRSLVPVLLALAVGVAFAPALLGPFLQWDDIVLLVYNTSYRGFGWSNLRWMATTNLMGHYMPLTWLSYALDHAVWGQRPSGFHFTNIALHAVNATFVYFVALRLIRIAWARSDAGGAAGALRIGAAFSAVVFAIHPLRAESVAWITERRDVLCGFFCLLAVLLYLKACELPRGDRRGSKFYWAALGSFVLSLLSKSMAATLPAVLLILDVYPLRRLRPGARGWLWPGPRRVWLEKIPFVLVSALVSGLAFRALAGAAAATSWERLRLPGRIAISAYSIAFYLEKTLLPLALSPLYELSLPVRISDRRFIVAGTVVVLITLAALTLRRRWPAFLTAWTCYVVMLLPVVGIFHNGYQIAADRYTYLPGIAWALLAGGAVVVAGRELWGDRPARRVLGAAAVVVSSVATCALGLATWEQVKIWRDDETLWRRAMSLDPASSVAASNLGAALRVEGRLDQAVEFSRRALAIRPDYPEAHLNLGLAEVGLGRPAAAERHFRRVLELRPRSAPAHAALASALEAQGRLDEALDHFRLAVENDPGSADGRNNLGVALARRGRLAEAVTELSEAVRIDPSSAQAQNNLGQALAETGRLTEAVDHFRAALRSKPDSQQAHQNLEHARRLLGR